MPSTKYQDLQSPESLADDIESTGNVEQSNFPSPPDPKTWRAKLKKVLLVAVVIWGTFSILWNAWEFVHVKLEDRSCRCGNSIHEALKNKCVYDPLQLAWLPPHCRDDEITDAFRHAAPAMFNYTWPYYAVHDKNSRILTEEEVGQFAETGQVYYAVHAHHLAHCIFNWMKEVRVPKTKITIPKRVRGLGHAAHCSTVIMINDTLDALNSVSSVTLNADVHTEQSKKFHATAVEHGVTHHLGALVEDDA
jgi:hypothetical protein